MRRYRSPRASRTDHVHGQLDQPEFGEGAKGGTGQGRCVRAEARGEGRGAHGAVLTEEVEDPHAQRRRHRTDGGVQAPADRFGVEPDGNDVGDALRGRHLADDQVRAAPRHQPVDLTGDERRHLRLPAEPVTFALIDGRAGRG
jgi:hypothetical protein